MQDNTEGQDNVAGRGPSEATLARRDARIMLAPYVANLSSWHQQAARLLLAVDRAESRGESNGLPLAAVEQLIGDISRERDAFSAAASSIVSSRVDDLEKSFGRLLSDLQRAQARCETLSGHATR